MSMWYKITDPEDIEFDDFNNTIDVCYNTDKQGAYYVEIPVEYIIKELEKNGYKINREV